MSWVGKILFVRQAAMLAGACLLAACGQRGDLYLPQSPEAAQRTRLPGVVFMPRAAPAAATMASEPASAASAAMPAH